MAKKKPKRKPRTVYLVELFDTPCGRYLDYDGFANKQYAEHSAREDCRIVGGRFVVREFREVIQPKH
jgi:hypothetical protein